MIKWNTKTWELNETEGIGVPVPVAVVIALSMGAVFALFLPFIGIGLVCYHSFLWLRVRVM